MSASSPSPVESSVSPAAISADEPPAVIPGDEHPLPDMPCLTCGYNLHGLRSVDNCPECGSAIRTTLDIWVDSIDGQQIPAVQDALFMLVAAPLCVTGLTILSLIIAGVTGLWGIGALVLIYGAIGTLAYIFAHFGFIAGVEQALNINVPWRYVWYAVVGACIVSVMAIASGLGFVLVLLVLAGWMAMHGWSAHMATHLARRAMMRRQAQLAAIVRALSMGGAALSGVCIVMSALVGVGSSWMAMDLAGVCFLVMTPYSLLVTALHCAMSIGVCRRMREGGKISRAFLPPASTATTATATAGGAPPSFFRTPPLDAGAPFGPDPRSATTSGSGS